VDNIIVRRARVERPCVVGKESLEFRGHGSNPFRLGCCLSISGRFRRMSDSGVGNKRIFGSVEGSETKTGPGFGGVGLGLCNRAVARDNELVRD
jgi:hypothetical protein